MVAHKLAFCIFLGIRIILWQSNIRCPVFVSDAYWLRCRTVLNITPPQTKDLLHLTQLPWHQGHIPNAFFFTMMLRILVITFPMRFATDLIRFYNSTYMTISLLFSGDLDNVCLQNCSQGLMKHLGREAFAVSQGFWAQHSRLLPRWAHLHHFCSLAFYLKATLLPVCKNLRDLCRHTAMMAGGGFSVS